MAMRKLIAKVESALSRCNSNEGSSIVEFAFSASILFVVVLGLVECSVMLYADHYVQNAAAQGARYAMVHGTSYSTTTCASYASMSCEATASDVNNFVQSIIPPAINPKNILVTTNWPGTEPAGDTCDNISGNNSPTCVVTVQVQYSFNFLLPFVTSNAVTLVGTSSQVIMQ
jgi:Flp pilus assembly protein TadG